MSRHSRKMERKIEIDELAWHFHELFGCRYIAIELDKLPDDDGLIDVTVCGSDSIMEYKYDFPIGYWLGKFDNTASISLPLVDTTGECSTCGGIDFSKCQFDFGEEEENEIV